MDEPILILAILSLGLFIGVLVTALFYVFTLRPRLVIPRTVPEVSPVMPSVDFSALQESMSIQQEMTTRVLEQLAHYVQQQTAQMDVLRNELRTYATPEPRGEGVQRSDVDLLYMTLQEHTAFLRQIDLALKNSPAVTTRMLRRISRQLTTHSLSFQRVARQMKGMNEDAVVLKDLRAQISAMIGILNQSQGTSVAKTTVVKEHLLMEDRLTDIKGIGPVYANQLREAGIYTFKQLANLTADELRAILSITGRRRNFNAESWIQQAQLLAKQRESLERNL